MKVISSSQLPARLPVGGTLLLYVIMDIYHSPGWVRGVAWTLMTIIWIVAISLIIKQDQAKIRPSSFE